ncbi:MAG: serine protease [Lachnospiraceae bacterium]
MKPRVGQWKKRIGVWGGAISMSILLGTSSFCILPVQAMSSTEVLLPPLIQTMTESDEYRGLLHLGMLDTQILAVESEESAYEAVHASIVKLNFGEIYGSGAILRMTEDKILIVTCRHLLEYAPLTNKISVHFNDDTSLQGNVTYLSDQYDLGFVEVPIAQVSIDILRELRQVALPPQGYTTKAGMRMFHVGSVGGVGKQWKTGVIENPWQFFPEFNSFMMHNACEGKPGMSGGGVFDAYGHYIGMICGGLEQETASLPWSIIQAEMKGWYGFL